MAFVIAVAATALISANASESQTASCDQNLPISEWSDCTGIAVYTDGSRYEGEFLEGMRHGQGRLTSSVGEALTGQFIKGRPVGYGELTYTDGAIFRGEFYDFGDREGTLTLPSGETATGRWINGQFQPPFTLAQCFASCDRDFQDSLPVCYQPTQADYEDFYEGRRLHHPNDEYFACIREFERVADTLSPLHQQCLSVCESSLGPNIQRK